MNLATLITGIIVLLIVVLAIRSLIRERRSGKCSCGCSSCSGSCPHCAVFMKNKGEKK